MPSKFTGEQCIVHELFIMRLCASAEMQRRQCSPLNCVPVVNVAASQADPSLHPVSNECAHDQGGVYYGVLHLHVQ